MKFSMNKTGCIEARKWLKKENLLSSCGPSDCDGITFIVCANELWEQHINSPYFRFAEIRCYIKDLTELLDTGCISKDDLDILDEKIGNMVSAFTDLLINE